MPLLELEEDEAPEEDPEDPDDPEELDAPPEDPDEPDDPNDPADPPPLDPDVPTPSDELVTNPINPHDSSSSVIVGAATPDSLKLYDDVLEPALTDVEPLKMNDVCQFSVPPLENVAPVGV